MKLDFLDRPELERKSSFLKNDDIWPNFKGNRNERFILEHIAPVPLILFILMFFLLVGKCFCFHVMRSFGGRNSCGFERVMVLQRVS